MSPVQLSLNSIVNPVENRSFKPSQLQFITKSNSGSTGSSSSIDEVTISSEALRKSTIYKAMSEAAR